MFRRDQMSGVSQPLGQEGMTDRMSRAGRLLAAGGVIGVIMLLLAWMLFDLHRVHGSQIGVMETFSKGVVEEPLPPRTYVLFTPMQSIFDYSTALQLFVMNDKSTAEGEVAEGREKDSYLVQSSDQQDLKISLQVQWRIDPTKVVQIHRGVRDAGIDNPEMAIRERLLRPVVMLEVKNAATKRTAINAYSGDGLVKLQAEIHDRLIAENGELRQRGIFVENFVIEHIGLNPDYTREITERQIAIQRKSKEDELTKAAEAKALRVKAEAQADLNTQVVAAERDKQVGILKAEQLARQNVLAATASKETQVLQATGGRDAAILEAEGTLAKGKAEAEAQKLRLSAYAVPGADAFVKIEVARSFGTAMSGVKGWLPEGMSVYTIGGDYKNAIETAVGALKGQ